MSDNHGAATADDPLDMAEHEFDLFRLRRINGDHGRRSAVHRLDARSLDARGAWVRRAGRPDPDLRSGDRRSADGHGLARRRARLLAARAGLHRSLAKIVGFASRSGRTQSVWGWHHADWGRRGNRAA